MSSFQRVRILPSTFGDKSSHIQSKYYCEASENQIKSSLELKSSLRQHAKNPLCFVLVIDASTSMMEAVGNESITLFDRMKTFAHMMINSLSKDDYLSIISFANKAIVDLGITKMDIHGKKLAKQAVLNQEIRGVTNLEAGMTEALQQIKGAEEDMWQKLKVRSSIILFTDGLPNVGLIDAESLVNKYKTIERSRTNKSCIPLSAFTIGDYKPEVLVEIASKLNNEAFYRLDESQDFETDMMIPLLLKKRTHVSDIQVNLEAVNDIEFCQEKTWKDHLQGQSKSQLTYFLHSLPADIPKTIQFHLELPTGLTLSMLHGQTIMHVNISYLDENMDRVEFQDVISFSQSTMFKIMSESLNTKVLRDLDPDTLAYIESAYSFTSVKNKTYDNWKEVKTSLVKNAQMDCMKHAIDVIETAQCDPSTTGVVAEDKLKSIEQTSHRVEKILRDDLTLEKLDEYIKKLKGHIETSRQAANKGQSYSQLAAISSALKNETPAAGGVTGMREQNPLDDILQGFLMTLKEARSRLRRFAPSKRSHNYERLSEILNSIHGEQNEDDLQSDQDDDSTPWIFDNFHFVLSGNFENATELQKMIEMMGGFLEIPIGKRLPEGCDRKMYVICSKNGERNDDLIKEAQKRDIPVVNEKFVYECVEKKEVVSWFKYGLRK